MDARVDYEACTVEVGDLPGVGARVPASIDPGTLRGSAGDARLGGGEEAVR